MKGMTKMLPRWKSYPQRIALERLDSALSRSSHRKHAAQVFSSLHLGEVNLHVQDGDSLDGILNLLPNPDVTTPLHTLRISVYNNRRLAVIPLHMVAAGAPNLCHLELNGCSVDWSTVVSSKTGARGPDFPSLLVLHTADLESPPPPHFLDSVLARSPRLQHLDIQRSLPDN